MYQRRSGDRLFGAGDHIGLVVDLEGQSGQTGRQIDGTGLVVKHSKPPLWRGKKSGTRVDYKADEGW